MLVKDQGVVLCSINNDLPGAGDHGCADGHVGDDGKCGADDYHGGKLRVVLLMGYGHAKDQDNPIKNDLKYLLAVLIVYREANVTFLIMYKEVQCYC